MRYIVTAMGERSDNVAYLERHIPNLEVVWDQKHDAMDTFLRACQAGFGSDVVRLEDDICLTVGFIDKIEDAIRAHSDDVIQFFSRSKYDPSIGSRYRGGGTWLMNQCHYLPRGVCEDIVEFYGSPAWEARREEHPTGFDTLMGDLFKAQKRRYWVHVPSLVEHAKIASAIDSRRSRFRQSTTFTEPELGGFPYELVVE